jgi:hypothetical protein
MNYWLGGKDHYPVDRALGEQVEQAFPEIVELMRADRRFIVRSVTHLAREEGIRQFLDIGTGLPTANNTHEVAQSVAPESKIVYVDNDPLVLAHARALLTSTPEGTTDYIDADLTAKARQHLASVGLHPAVHTIDGRKGWPGNAPYDRIMATCSAPSLPYAWVAQTRDDGMILANVAGMLRCAWLRSITGVRIFSGSRSTARSASWR